MRGQAPVTIVTILPIERPIERLNERCDRHDGKFVRENQWQA